MLSMGADSFSIRWRSESEFVPGPLVGVIKLADNSVPFFDGVKLTVVF
jgi:uncharacterized protein YqfB (UPF0267 family)